MNLVKIKKRGVVKKNIFIRWSSRIMLMVSCSMLGFGKLSVNNLTTFLFSLLESHQCVFRYKIDERVCDYNYSYESIGKHQTLIKIRDVKCEEVKSAAIYVSIIVLIVFATGMIIVLGYRLKTWREDKAIFAKFEKERAHETEYRELSPIYRSPISSFQVPPEMEATVL